MLHYTVNQHLHWACRQYARWSLWANPGMARCQEMSTLPVEYIPQCKVTLASSSGSLGFIVCEVVVEWLIVYQDGYYLYLGQYSQTICESQIMMIPRLR